jgi:hypothetical protein
MSKTKPRPVIIGFREWVSLPDLGIVAVKCKVDTGAKTSSLHAFDIKVVKRKSGRWVKFKVHPLQMSSELVVECSAPLVDRRVVTDSGGHQETRLVIRTRMQLGGIKREIELTLTNRQSMKYRMLLGREALGEFYIDPCQSYLMKKTSRQRAHLKEIEDQRLKNPPPAADDLRELREGSET